MSEGCFWWTSACSPFRMSETSRVGHASANPAMMRSCKITREKMLEQAARRLQHSTQSKTLACGPVVHCCMQVAARLTCTASSASLASGSSSFMGHLALCLVGSAAGRPWEAGPAAALLPGVPVRAGRSRRWEHLIALACSTSYWGEQAVACSMDALPAVPCAGT